MSTSNDGISRYVDSAVYSQPTFENGFKIGGTPPLTTFDKIGGSKQFTLIGPSPAPVPSPYLLGTAGPIIFGLNFTGALEGTYLISATLQYDMVTDLGTFFAMDNADVDGIATVNAVVLNFTGLSIVPTTNGTFDIINLSYLVYVPSAGSGAVPIRIQCIDSDSNLLVLKAAMTRIG